MAISSCSEAIGSTIQPGSNTDVPAVMITDPTKTQSPTETLLPLNTPTQFQFPTDLPPIVVEQPTPEGTEQNTFDYEGRKILPAVIQIRKPGEGSRVASPLTVQTYVYPGDDGRVLIQLLGEDGRVMAEQLKTVIVPATGWIELVTQIPFEISSAGEAALVVVSTSDGYGRRVAQATASVVLLQIGKSEIELPGFMKEPFFVDTPVFGEVIKNGVLHISGLVHPFGEGPLVADLVADNGGILKSVIVQIPETINNQDFVPFSLDIPYSVDQRTPVRLMLRQVDERLFEVDVSLKSMIIYLEP